MKGEQLQINQTTTEAAKKCNTHVSLQILGIISAHVHVVEESW